MISECVIDKCLVLSRLVVYIFIVNWLLFIVDCLFCIPSVWLFWIQSARGLLWSISSKHVFVGEQWLSFSMLPNNNFNHPVLSIYTYVLSRKEESTLV